MFRPMISIAMKPQISDAKPEQAQVDRPDLGVADDAEQVAQEAACPVACRCRP